MSNKQLIIGFVLLVFNSQAQFTRMSLYESFCGETCPPCATTNPGLNALLSSPVNTPNVISISWETPIPSAPTNTWSLYQTNKQEHDWRWKSVAAGGYGYNINYVPQGRMDGQHATVFGASSDHPANLTSTVIATAHSYTTPFSISLFKAWDPTYSTIYVSVMITASSSFTSTGNLVFRLVMIEREVHFQTPSGTNGEKDFYNTAVKSFPTLQAGTPMSQTWVQGQTQSMVLTCPLPPYIRDKSEIAMVGFIQDDGNQKVWQAALAEKTKFPNDAKAVSVNFPKFICKPSITPTLVIENCGNNAISDVTVTPYVDGVSCNPTMLQINLGAGATNTFVMNAINFYQMSGTHTLSCVISGVSGGDMNMLNNTKSSSFSYLPAVYQMNPVNEGFGGAFPPANWTVLSPLQNLGWQKCTSTGGFQLSNECAGIYFNGMGQGQSSDLILPPVDLSGSDTPALSFDLAYTYPYPYTYGVNDTLQVLVSYDCGNSWTVVYSKSGPLLSTFSGGGYPQSYNDWRRESIALMGLNISEVKVKFRAVKDVGGSLFIDNVNLVQNNPVSVSNYSSSKETIGIGPNPFNGQTYLWINAVQDDLAEVIVSDNLGQCVYKFELAVKSGSNKTLLDLSSFSEGIYQMSVRTSKGITSSKLCLKR